MIKCLINCILLLYDFLLNKQIVSRSDFCVEQNISERTFYRYINDISVYLMKKGSFVIDVIEPHGLYYLKATNRI